MLYVSNKIYQKQTESAEVGEGNTVPLQVIKIYYFPIYYFV